MDWYSFERYFLFFCEIYIFVFSFMCGGYAVRDYSMKEVEQKTVYSIKGLDLKTQFILPKGFSRKHNLFYEMVWVEVHFYAV